MVVATGGTGDIGLGAVTGYPPIGETLGTNKSFHYVIRAVNNTPLEAGVGVMTDVITLRRDNVYAKMVNGVYSAGDGLTNLSIPVGAFLYTADTKEMLEDLQLELPLRDYGNVSGATGVDLRNSAIKLNLTANATLTFSEPPPVGVKAEITLHATSANAGTADIGKGYLLTLPAACKLGKNNCPPIPLTHNTETVLTLTTTNGGSSYQVHWQNADVNINDLGDIAETASMALDIRYTQTKGRFISATKATFTVSGVSPAALLGEPAHFSFVNDGSINKNIIFNAEIFTLISSNLNSFTLPIAYKADFTIRKNPNALDANPAYDVWINSINYNQTASGTATTWNPSDKNANIALTDGNTTAENSTTTGANVIASVRAFGGKNSGRWRLALVCISPPVASVGGTNSGNAYISFGVSDASLALNSVVGSSATSYAMFVGLSQATPVQLKRNNNVATNIGTASALLKNDILEVLVDLDVKKIWFLLNGVVISGGDPEAGTGQDFNLNASPIYFPALTAWEARNGTGTASAGIWLLANEVQNPYANNRPSFKTWTA